MTDYEKLVVDMINAYDKVQQAAFTSHMSLSAVKRLAMEAAIRAIDASGTHCVVPRVPTQAMLDAGTKADWVGEYEGRAGRSILPLSEDEKRERTWYCEEGDELPIEATSPGIWDAMLKACLAERQRERT